MAQKRMFSLRIIDTDLFLDMPSSTQLLYFHLSLRADDDGFISSPKKITKMVNCSDDDLKLLTAKKFIIPFESGICVIKHWRIHNYIQKDRYSETLYKVEMAQLEDSEGVYSLDTKCVQDVHEMDTQIRLGKSREELDINKDKPKKNVPVKINYAEFVSMTETEYNKLLAEHGVDKVKKSITILDNYKGSNNKKYTSDYRAILSWVLERVEKEKPTQQGPNGIKGDYKNPKRRDDM